MVQSLWEVGSVSPSQEISHVLWNLRAHYCTLFSLDSKIFCLETMAEYQKEKLLCMQTTEIMKLNNVEDQDFCISCASFCTLGRIFPAHMYKNTEAIVQDH